MLKQLLRADNKRRQGWEIRHTQQRETKRQPLERRRMYTMTENEPNRLLPNIHHNNERADSCIRTRKKRELANRRLLCPSPRCPLTHCNRHALRHRTLRLWPGRVDGGGILLGRRMLCRNGTQRRATELRLGYTQGPGTRWGLQSPSLEQKRHRKQRNEEGSSDIKRDWSRGLRGPHR